MRLSKRIRKWKANLTTQTPVEYVLTLRADVNGFADEVKVLESENAKLRELLTFYLGCLTKGHVNCESCVVSDEDDCGHGRMVIERARELGIEVD